MTSDGCNVNDPTIRTRLHTRNDPLAKMHGPEYVRFEFRKPIIVIQVEKWFRLDHTSGIYKHIDSTYFFKNIVNGTRDRLLIGIIAKNAFGLYLLGKLFELRTVGLAVQYDLRTILFCQTGGSGSDAARRTRN